MDSSTTDARRHAPHTRAPRPPPTRRTRYLAPRPPPTRRTRYLAALSRDLTHDAIRARCRAIRRAGGDASAYLTLLEAKIRDERRRWRCRQCGAPPSVRAELARVVARSSRPRSAHGTLAARADVR